MNTKQIEPKQIINPFEAVSQLVRGASWDKVKRRIDWQKVRDHWHGVVLGAITAIDCVQHPSADPLRELANEIERML